MGWGLWIKWQKQSETTSCSVEDLLHAGIYSGPLEDDHPEQKDQIRSGGKAKASQYHKEKQLVFFLLLFLFF